MSSTLCVGTCGTSVWFSKDLGETWDRPYSESGLYCEARVWALAIHPNAPGEVLAGTDSGIYRWDEANRRWTHLPSPMDRLCVWTLAQSPTDPKIIVAGTQPAGLFRSIDGGATWKKLEADFAESCPFISHPRVTKVLFDGSDPKTIWASVEIDSVHRSKDGGDTWERLGKGLVSGDIHDIALVGRNGAAMYATSNKGLHRSEDGGASWELQPLQSPWQYTRAVVERPDNIGTVFLTNGNGPPGSTGRLLRSRDYGKTWEDANLPGELNSTPWGIATNADDPNIMFVVTNLGQLFRSTDGGEQWTKLKREFGEIRSVAWYSA